MRALNIASSLLAALVITGCAHPIVITPDVAKIERPANAKPIINKNVAYYIAPANRILEVETPGGGGDKVKYLPYKELETGLYKMLSNVFKDVTVLNAENDAETIKSKSVSYVIKPTITTNSSSPSPFTWPPTKFTVNLTCDFIDEMGKALFSKSVTGEGAAEFDEFKADFSLSAKRASQDALLKMQNLLLQAPELSK